MSVRVAAVGYQRSLKFALGLQDQPLVEETHACFGKRGRVLLRRQGGQASLVHLLHFKGSLAEGGLVEAPFDSLQGQVLGLRGWIKSCIHPIAWRAGRGRRMLRLSANSSLEGFGLGI